MTLCEICALRYLRRETSNPCVVHSVQSASRVKVPEAPTLEHFQPFLTRFPLEGVWVYPAGPGLRQPAVM